MGGKSATEIAETYTDQETGEPPGGANFESDQVQNCEAGPEGDRVCTDQETGEPPGGTGF